MKADHTVALHLSVAAHLLHVASEGLIVTHKNFPVKSSPLLKEEISQKEVIPLPKARSITQYESTLSLQTVTS